MIDLLESDFHKTEEFELIWRWTDEKFSVFDPEEMSSIKALIPESACKLYEIAEQNCSVPKNYDYELVITENEDDKIHSWLSSLPVSASEKVIALWSPELAVQIPYSLFLKRWSDFWYPSSDDLLIVPMELSWLLSLTHFGKVGWRKTTNCQRVLPGDRRYAPAPEA